MWTFKEFKLIITKKERENRFFLYMALAPGSLLGRIGG
jgi:hypothetical protein